MSRNKQVRKQWTNPASKSPFKPSKSQATLSQGGFGRDMNVNLDLAQKEQEK